METRLSQTNRAILFRYHDHLDVCENRIALLRHFNPNTPIFGMYGGPPLPTADAKDRPNYPPLAVGSKLPKQFRGGVPSPPYLNLDSTYILPFPEPRFKWEHGDLCIRQWFIDQGHTLDFDILHVVEWDLILLDSLENLFGHITDGVALSHRLPLTQLRDEGWGWITNPQRAAQFEELCDLIESRHGVHLTQENILAGSFPTATLSRTFLKRYAAEPDVPPLTHDEIRMATFATAYGLPVHDTKVPFDPIYWNCEKAYFPIEQILAGAAQNHKVFHPVKDLFPLSALSRT